MEINCIRLPFTEWAILYLKFYADYEYTGHSENVFTNFQYTLSSGRNRFALQTQ